jgi:hypothetical protein
MRGDDATFPRRTARIVLAVTALLAAALLLRGLTEPPGAGAAKPKLKAAERAALDIRQIHVTSKSEGLRVSVVMAGDVEKRLGRGGLAGAAVAVVLVPKTGSAKSGAVVSGRPAKEKAEGQGAGKRVTIGGKGKLLRFYLPAADPDAVETVVVKTLINRQGAKARTAASALLKLALRCGKAPVGRAAQSDPADDPDADEYIDEGLADSGSCAGDSGSVGDVPRREARAAACRDAQYEVERLELDEVRAEADLEYAVAKNYPARIRELRAALSAIEQKLDAARAKRDELCRSQIGGSAGHDHTYDPQNQGFSSVCVDASTDPPLANAAWTVAFHDDSGKDADKTAQGTTGADGRVRAVFRITSGSKAVRLTVRFTASTGPHDRTFTVQVPAPDGSKTLDCRALNAG